MQWQIWKQMGRLAETLTLLVTTSPGMIVVEVIKKVTRFHLRRTPNTLVKPRILPNPDLVHNMKR